MTCGICGVQHGGVKDGVCTRPSCMRAAITALTKAVKAFIGGEK